MALSMSMMYRFFFVLLHAGLAASVPLHTRATMATPPLGPTVEIAPGVVMPTLNLGAKLRLRGLGVAQLVYPHSDRHVLRIFAQGGAELVARRRHDPWLWRLC